MASITAADVVGVFGAGLIVLAYFLLQVGRLDPRSITYSALNGVGAAAIIFSLVFEFNLAAFTIEAFWLAISMYGGYRAFKRRKLPADRS